jgi:hypothetical protein
MSQQPLTSHPAHPGQPHHDEQTAERTLWTMMWFGFLAFWPRLFILGFWIFGSELGRAYSSWVIPALGFLVAPWTTFAYAWMWGLTSHGVHGAEWIVVGVGLLLDVWTWGLLGSLRRRD